jgi:hypothetical protein
VRKDDDVAVGEQPSMHTPVSPLLDRIEQRVTIPSRLIKWVSHLPSATEPRAVPQLRRSTLYFEDQEAALGVNHDEVRLAFS